MVLTEMTARVREDLKDTDEENYIWTDDEIEAAIGRAVTEYSIHAPIEQQTDIVTTDGNTEIDISGLTGLLQVASVEFPIGQSPKYMQHLERYAGHLYMEDEGDGSKARVRWLKIHTLDDESTTIPAEHEEIIVLGATGYLAMSVSAYTVDKATIAGSQATINYKAWGMERLQRYDKKLKDISLGNRVTQHQLYTDE
jgi:hypothetical protein